MEIHNGKQELVAAFPLQTKKKGVFSYFLQPKFTQYWGLICSTVSPLVRKQLSFEKKCINLVLQELTSRFSFAEFNLSPNFNYLLPFEWQGCLLKNKYTYQIDLSEDEDVLLNNIENSNRSLISKFPSNFQFNYSSDPSDLIALYKKEKPKSAASFANKDWENFSACVQHFSKRQQCEIIEVRDGDQLVAGMTFFIYKSTLTYFFGTTDASYKKVGAMTSIVWEAITRHKSKADTFDFEGSVIESLEAYARKFNAHPTAYASVQMNKLPLPLRIWKQLKFR